MKKIEIFLLVAVCALSFVSYKQYKDIKNMQYEISDLRSDCKALKHECQQAHERIDDLLGLMETLSYNISYVESSVDNVRADIEFNERMKALYGR